MLDEQLQGSRLLIIGQPGLEPVAMVDEQLDQVLGVLRVVFRPAGRECLAVLGERGRINWVEDKKSYFKRA